MIIKQHYQLAPSEVYENARAWTLLAIFILSNI